MEQRDRGKGGRERESGEKEEGERVGDIKGVREDSQRKHRERGSERDEEREREWGKGGGREKWGI